MDVVVVGAINVDFVVEAERLPGPGETVVGGDVSRHGGGKGANAAVAAARVGARVKLVGAVGADPTGVEALAELQAEGVDTAQVAVLPGTPTGVALISVAADGENQITVGAGANGALTALHVEAALTDALSGALPTGTCVLVSTEIPLPAVAAALRGARHAGVTCVLNPAPVVPGLAGLLEHEPLITPNRSEALALAGELEIPVDDVRRLSALLAHRTGSPVAITLGADGVAVFVEHEPEVVLAPRATARDTTGAGDTFNGVFAARLAAGDPLSVAARYGVVAASLSVEEVGARSGMPSAAAVEAALRR
ncbi:ribokinase [Spongisporangium articulatum]|uniref:Ribokinase n=1 Tax=Spongisporangium articulatum TaxID=3362603 RepID=A0ABW8AKG8_9ACTN